MHREKMFGYDIDVMGRFRIRWFVASCALLNALALAQSGEEIRLGRPDTNPFFIEGFELPGDFSAFPKASSRTPGVAAELLSGVWVSGGAPVLNHLLGTAETGELARNGDDDGNALLLRINEDGSYALLLYLPTSDPDSSDSKVFLEAGEFGWMGMVLVLKPAGYIEIAGEEGKTNEVAREEMPRTYALYTARLMGSRAGDGDEVSTFPGIILEGPLCPSFMPVDDGYCSDLGEGRVRFLAEFQKITGTAP
jgi:hypothetical protein